MRKPVATALIAVLSVAFSIVAVADDVKTQVNGFADDASNYIVTGALKYENEFHEKYTIGFKGVVDGISSATAKARDHQRTLNGLSSASLREKRDRLGGFVGGFAADYKNAMFEAQPDISNKNRVEFSAFGEAEISDTTISAGGMYSQEAYYRSTTAYGTFVQSLALQNTQLSATYYHNFDTVESSDDWVATNLDYPKPKDVDGVNLGFTQTLSRRAIAQIVGSAIFQRGALEDPERDVFGFTGDQWYLMPERLPHRRNRFAASARVIHSLWKGSALEGGYRYYSDTWGIDSHTGSLAWRQYLAPWALLAARGRFYSQGESDYMMFEADPAVEDYYSAAPSMQSFTSSLFGGSITLISKRDLWADGDISGGVGVDSYQQASRDGLDQGYRALIGRANLVVEW